MTRQQAHRIATIGTLTFAIAAAASASSPWTIISSTGGATPYLNAAEGFLMSGAPWDSDGSPLCPPAGADDAICDWLGFPPEYGAADPDNGVLAAVFSGASGQNAVFLSPPWSDSLASPVDTWFYTYNIRYVAADPNDLTDLRVTTQMQLNGSTQLTLLQIGQVDGEHVQFVTAPAYHTWTENPETGSTWRARITLQRTSSGQPAMIWIDNANIMEVEQVYLDDDFAVEPADLNGDGHVTGIDLALLLGAWGRCSGCDEDLNSDGAVNGIDLAILLGGWG